MAILYTYIRDCCITTLLGICLKYDTYVKQWNKKSTPFWRKQRKPTCDKLCGQSNLGHAQKWLERAAVQGTVGSRWDQIEDSLKTGVKGHLQHVKSPGLCSKEKLRGDQFYKTMEETRFLAPKELKSNGIRGEKRL